MKVVKISDSPCGHGNEKRPEKSKMTVWHCHLFVLNLNVVDMHVRLVQGDLTSLHVMLGSGQCSCHLSCYDTGTVSLTVPYALLFIPVTYSFPNWRLGPSPAPFTRSTWHPIPPLCHQLAPCFVVLVLRLFIHFFFKIPFMNAILFFCSLDQQLQYHQGMC